MANTKELRRRIKSVKNTSQITKAMQMVAATKMRKAQLQALGGRPYIEYLLKGLTQLLLSNDEFESTYLEEKESAKTGILLLSTDKSLCGALNTNLFRAVSGFAKDKDVAFYTIGKKGRGFVVKQKKSLEMDFENKDLILFSESLEISKILMNAFLSSQIGELFICYSHFVSTLTQTPSIKKLLPIDLSESMNPEGEGVQNPYLIEPDSDSLVEYLLSHFIEAYIYQAMLETKASEHSSRMIAMQNATDNALELVEDLLLTYNQTRQASITTELLEITSAQAAME